jgi:hypothetical protein
VSRNPGNRRFAERTLLGIDDEGNEERVLVWVEYQPGAVWAVGRVVNQHLRPSDEPRSDDFIFQGYELDDALNEANAALDDDLRVSSEEGIEQNIPPFTREEMIEPLERWFFHHSEDEADRRE